ncbi:hypothetical protein [Stigmatella aurantiaca]|uniref:Conserved uncharacterized protein n=1 Tax=Stigmatella aurantiaca (strain DW4/3-1) TaxID=378806 RepID=Q08T40_STIAD|nr:hypothetical protein [Stigmatella aurantiaca]ADO73802.1 conserved uncharacterized protein [Stigmatella aurantiaca DW4/3-1]EAU63648.1 hypothetical protein STIAU_7597 [Stigmatella aurantiaca DW4/3-1]
MRRSLWVLCAALACSACKKEQANPEVAPAKSGQRSPAVPQGGQAPGEAPGGAQEAPGGYAVTPEKLEAYVGYQRKLVEAYAALSKDLAAVKGKPETAGSMAEVNATMKFIEGKAVAEEKARKEAGLSEVDINGLADVVTAVIGQRQMVQTLQFDEELKKLEAMQAKLSQEQQKELAPQLEAMRERVESLRQLTEVRRTYGDANVDTVLTREADLAKNYQDMMSTFGKR